MTSAAPKCRLPMQDVSQLVLWEVCAQYYLRSQVPTICEEGRGREGGGRERASERGGQPLQQTASFAPPSTFIFLLGESLISIARSRFQKALDGEDRIEKRKCLGEEGR